MKYAKDKESMPTSKSYLVRECVFERERERERDSVCVCVCARASERPNLNKRSKF